ncbi:MAG TPA: hydroxyacid dehydrogenase [Candidatus Methylacidiphilales bacterium]
MKTPALFLLDEEHWSNVFGPVERKRLEALVPTPLRFHTKESILKAPRDLEAAEVIFSGWGMVPCDEDFLERAPNLKAIFYAAGSVRPFVTETMWRRGIVVSSTNSALTVPVAEFTLGQILLSLKSTWRHISEARATRQMVRRTQAGTYDSVVGLISLGAVARHLLSLLRSFHFDVVVYDPFLSKEAARKLDVESVSLEDLFELSDVVSLHTPWLPQTEGMIRGHHLARMKSGATFINTARGAVVNEKEMIEVLARRPDLYALLDVTFPEPPPPSSPLFTLPNVLLTPHIAGALGTECRRLGSMAIDEFERYLKGERLCGEVCEEMMATIA